MSSQLKASTVAPPPLQRTAEFPRLRALSFRESPEFFLTVESHFVTRVRTQLSRSCLLKTEGVYGDPAVAAEAEGVYGVFEAEGVYGDFAPAAEAEGVYGVFEAEGVYGDFAPAAEVR